MGRHNAPEGRHRRNGALLAQAGLVMVLGLVMVSVLLGSGLVRDRMVDGTFSGLETADPGSSGVEVPETSPGPSAGHSATASSSDQPSGQAGASASATSDTVVASSSAAPTGSETTSAPADTSSAQISSSSAPSSSASSSSASSSAPSSAPSSSAPSSESATPTVTPTATPAPAAEHFTTCAQAKAAGVSMIPRADPRYTPQLDRDHDGTACDRHGDPSTPTPAPTTPEAVEPQPNCVATGG